MDPKKHPSNNLLVGPPANWDDRGGALKLRAIDATRGNLRGVDLFVTWWQPTKDELALLLQGGQVQVVCIGGQPAMQLDVVNVQASSSLVLPH